MYVLQWHFWPSESMWYKPILTRTVKLIYGDEGSKQGWIVKPNDVTDLTGFECVRVSTGNEAIHICYNIVRDSFTSNTMTVSSTSGTLRTQNIILSSPP